MQTPSEPTDDDRPRTALDRSTDPTRDAAYGLLRSGRRRRVVDHLLGFVGEPVPVDALATAVARREHDTAAAGLDADARERVALSLDHCHLPKLQAAGVVDYDRRRGTVTATPRLEALEPYLVDESEAARSTESDGVASLAAFGRRHAAGAAAVLLAALSALLVARRRDRGRET